MTRRINQKIAHKRKLNDQHTAEKEAKKARKVEITTNTPSSLVVDQLVGGSSLALSALGNLARCGVGGGDGDPPDEIDEFFAGGGQASHILHMLDTNQEKNRANDVAAVFNTVEAVITRVVRGQDKLGDRSLEVATELVKRVNADYAKEIVLLLSGTNTAYQAKSVLRMLTAMVTLGPVQAREVLMKVNWEHDNWDTLCKRSSKKDPPDVRTCFIHFLLAFLFEPSPLVLKDFFSLKTRLASLFPGLMHDTAETVMLVLETLRSKVVENPAVSKTQKMKVFGSHNIKPLLALLKWTGPKKDDPTDNVEEKESVEESVISILKVVLGSTKHGVVFPDPMVGQNEKTLNPLAKEVLFSMTKPWESLAVSSVVVELVSACPDQLGVLFGILEENWLPRDSPSWHQVIDLIITVLEKMDCRVIGEGMKTDFPVGKVVENVIFSSKLLEKVVCVGLGMDSMVSNKCLELLEVLMVNLEQFLSSVAGNQAGLVKDSAKSLVRKFLDLNALWESLAGYINKGQNKQVMNILTVLNFVMGTLGLVSDFNIGNLLIVIEENEEKLGEHFKAIQLRALKLFSMFTSTSLTSSSLLSMLCTKEIFLMLLENIGDNDGQEKFSSSEILSGLVRNSGICLPTSLDLDLLLALVDRENFSFMANSLLDAKNGKKKFEERILELKHEEIILRNKNNQSQASLFEALMSPDFTPAMVSSYCKPDNMEQLFSPLILSILNSYEQNNALVESFLSKLVFLFQDVDVFCKQLKNLVGHFSSCFTSFLSSVLSPTINNPPVMSPPSQPVWTLAQSCLVQIIHFPSSSPADITKLIATLPRDMQAGLVRLMVQRLSKTGTFNPYMSSTNLRNDMVVTVLKLAHSLNILTPDIQEEFSSATREYLTSIGKEKARTNPDSSVLSECFTLLPLSCQSLHEFSSCLATLPANMFCSSQSTTLITVLVGVFHGLSKLQQSELMNPMNVTMVAKLTCLVEVLLDTESDLQDLARHLTTIVKTSPAICAALSSNLVVVLIKSCRPSYLSLAECLVSLEKKHLESFKAMVCQEKHLVTEKLLPLMRVVLQSQDFESEKKFITIVLKRVVNQVENTISGKVEFEGELFDIVTLLSKNSKTDKQVELWKKTVGDKVDSVEDCLEDSVNIVLLKVKILVTLQKISGSCDSRLMKECFLPLLHHIGNLLKLGPSMETKLIHACRAATECKELVDNKIFSKEFGKNSSVWQKFYRNVLKYSLKSGSSGVPALDLLTSVCEFLMKGDKLQEAESIVEMVTNHSLYLGTLMGPGCPIKTSLMHLLLALSPVSCTMEQIPLLLSGYTATLHPSDRAILALLSLHEKAGLDLSQFQPFMFGPSAAHHYAVMAGGAWKQPKVSEVLGMLDKDIMRRSCMLFPLNLPLDPHAELEDGDCPDPSVYDPRFILPFLSQLLSQEMYMDKHMRLVDSGALSYAISSLSSTEWFVRAAGYHLLVRMITSMDTAKLAQEKQVWLQVLYLVKNGLASGSNISRCARLSSLITVFMGRVVDILSTPLSPLYKTISRSILAKPALDLQSVPEFSRLLNSSDLNSTTEQRWILEVVRDGIRDNLDYSLVSRSFVCKILQSRWGSLVMDRVGHLQSLDVLERCVSTKYGCVDLVTRHGLITWLVGIIRHDKVEKLFVKKVLKILKIVTENIFKIEQKKPEEKKGLLTKLMHTEVTILLGRVKEFAELKQEGEMLEVIQTIRSEISSICPASE